MVDMIKKTTRRIRSNNKHKPETDVEKKLRVDMCQGELSLVLTKYRCGIEPMVVITSKGVQCNVRIFPQDLQQPKPAQPG